MLQSMHTRPYCALQSVMSVVYIHNVCNSCTKFVRLYIYRATEIKYYDRTRDATFLDTVGVSNRFTLDLVHCAIFRGVDECGPRRVIVSNMKQY
jgi:hypothetical protein